MININDSLKYVDLFFMCSSAVWSLLVLFGQSSGGETPCYQHRNSREFTPKMIISMEILYN